MKYVMIAAFAATALSSTAALANPGNLNAEVRFGDVRSGQGNGLTEYRVQWDAPISNGFTYGAELQVRQSNHEGAVGSKLIGKIGYTLPSVLGFNTLAYGEVGKNIREGNNFGLWGAGVSANHGLYGPISVNAGYRHREAFTGVDRLKEDRLNAGLGYAITRRDTIGVNYYRTTGTLRADQVGVGITHSF